MTPYDNVQDAGSRASLRITHAQVLAEMAEYERVADEFGFEPYGTPAEEIASYNRHLAARRAQLSSQIAELKELVEQAKKRANVR